MLYIYIYMYIPKSIWALLWVHTSEPPSTMGKEEIKGNLHKYSLLVWYTNFIPNSGGALCTDSVLPLLCVHGNEEQ